MRPKSFVDMACHPWARHARRCAPAAGVAAALSLGLIALAGPAAAAPPAPLAQATSSCVAGSFSPSVYDLGLGSSAGYHLHRLTITGPASSGAHWEAFGGGNQVVLGGDVGWQVADVGRGSLATGLFATCTDGTTAAIDAFAIPAAPTAFSGRTRANLLDSNSVVAFVVPGKAPYVMDVGVQGGPLRVRRAANDLGILAASPGTYGLGVLEPGSHSYGVLPATSSPVAWSVSFRALPVPLSVTGISASVIRPGQLARLSFATGGDTSVAAQVTTEAGAPVRTLGVLPVGEGTHDLYWDGRDDFAGGAPDGRYVIGLHSRDPSGEGAAAAYPLTVDGTAPLLEVLTKRVAPAGAMRIRLEDGLSGLVARSVRLNGRDVLGRVVFGPDGIGRLRAPGGRFDVGRHRLQLSARDAAGNFREVTQVVTVPGRPVSSLSLRRKVTRIRVSARSGVTGRAQVTLHRGRTRIGACASRVSAGKRFSCWLKRPTGRARAPVRLTVAVRSSELRTTFRVQRRVRA